MIIVEGPDGSGKTTLVQHLADIFNLPISPRAVSKDTHALLDLKTYVEQTVNAGWQRKIYDRFSLISDPIYRLNMGKPVDVDMYQFEWQHEMFSRLIEEVRPLIIFCMPPWQIVRANIENDPDNVAIMGVIDRVYADYTVASAGCKVFMRHDVYIYDYTKPDAVSDVRIWLDGRIA